MMRSAGKKQKNLCLGADIKKEKEVARAAGDT